MISNLPTARRPATRHPTVVLWRSVLAAVLALAADQVVALPSAPPRAELVTEHVERNVSYRFVTGSMDRENQVVQPKRSVRATGDLTRRTWRLGAEDELDRVTQGIRTELAAAGSVLYSCEGRQCGRSTYWANNVFGVAQLNAPDSDQRYIAARIETDAGVELVGAYVVRRANGRVYAHADTLKVADAGQLNIEVDLAADLARDGFVRVPVPVRAEPGFMLEATVVEAVQRARRIVPDDELWVVCHMYGTASDELLVASRRCAERLAGQIGDGVRAFGAGPLLPRAEGEPLLRIELVAPGLLRRPDGPPR